MTKKKLHVKVNDRVVYAQTEMFDTTLVGKEGVVTKILKSSKEHPEVYALVFFGGNLGIESKVPISCLSKV
jgi:hypothetical protein